MDLSQLMSDAYHGDHWALARIGRIWERLPEDKREPEVNDAILDLLKSELDKVTLPMTRKVYVSPDMVELMKKVSKERFDTYFTTELSDDDEHAKIGIKIQEWRKKLVTELSRFDK
jgi:predicted RNA-binding protein YlxR (DUF448 family)